MAAPCKSNPLKYLIDRQYQDRIFIKNVLFKERLAKARNLFRKDLLAHYGCVNAIEFSNEGDLLVSGGDDRRVLVWSIPEAIYGNQKTPAAMNTNHSSNIFCLSFDSDNTKIYSGGNDDQVVIHDAITGNLWGKLLHESPVYGLSINPCNDRIVATAADEGKILLFDVRDTSNSEALCLAKEKAGFHSVKFSPTNPRCLVTANSEEGIALWDCRKPKERLIHYDSNAGIISGISACFNSNGSQVLALRRRLPPVLYSTESPNAICQFYHPQYYNSCTMKTCCFAGDDDEYILSGSDDFNLYMWQLPDTHNGEWGSSHLVLKGHRSIVNQVRYNKANNLVASSGVEKMIKLWSSLPIGTWKGSLQKEHADSPRAVYTHEDYIYLVGHSGGRISHDYSEHSTQEDSKMLAFFDSLIQREIEGWDSASEMSLTCSDNDDDDNSTDCDDNNKDFSLVNLLNIMYSKNIGRNGGSSSSSSCDDNNKKHKLNRIAQLILKKRGRLAKMAHDKAGSQIKRCHAREKTSKRKHAQKSRPSKQKKSTNKRTTKTTKQPKQSEQTTKIRKYRTRQSLREQYDSNSNNSFDAPSTSTGITSSNSIFRVIEQDSDEEPHHSQPVAPSQCGADRTNRNGVAAVEGEGEEAVDGNNFVNILPTPLNGTHDMYMNVLEVSNGLQTVRNDDFDESRASTSNSASISNDLEVAGEGNCDYGSDSDSDYEFDYRTPVKRRRTISASDSGCGTGPCSSSNGNRFRTRSHQQCSSSLYSNSNNNDLDSEDEYKYEKFKKRVNKARLNIRKQIGCDSDSN